MGPSAFKTQFNTHKCRGSVACLEFPRWPVFIWIAMGSPVAALDEQLLTVHMVQHLLLMTLAPPLIWLATPIAPLTHGFPEAIRANGLASGVRVAPGSRTREGAREPSICWLAASAALVGWHIPPAFALGMQSAVWHTSNTHPSLPPAFSSGGR